MSRVRCTSRSSRSCARKARELELGPLISEEQRDKVADLVDDAVGRGARALAGAQAPERTGWFYEPTVLVDVPHDARIERAETFGPVVTVSPRRTTTSRRSAPPTTAHSHWALRSGRATPSVHGAPLTDCARERCGTTTTRTRMRRRRRRGADAASRGSDARTRSTGSTTSRRRSSSTATRAVCRFRGGSRTTSRPQPRSAVCSARSTPTASRLAHAPPGASGVRCSRSRRGIAVDRRPVARRRDGRGADGRRRREAARSAVAPSRARSCAWRPRRLRGCAICRKAMR